MVRKLFVIACLLAVGLLICGRMSVAEIKYYKTQSDLSFIVEDTAGNVIQTYNYVNDGFSFSYNTDTLHEIQPPFDFRFYYAGITRDIGASELSAYLFNDISLIRNVGNTFWVSSGNDFSVFTSAMSNPTPYDCLWFMLAPYDSLGKKCGGTGIGMSLTTSNNLARGKSIGRLGLRINSASIVPEPSGLLAVMSGVIGLMGLAARRKQP